MQKNVAIFYKKRPKSRGPNFPSSLLVKYTFLRVSMAHFKESHSLGHALEDFFIPRKLFVKVLSRRKKAMAVTGETNYRHPLREVLGASSVRWLFGADMLL